MLRLFDDLSNNDVIEINNEIFVCIEEYISENVLEISNPLFHLNIINVVSDIIYETVQSIYTIEDYDEPYKEVFENVKEQVETYVNTIMKPPRSYIMGETVVQKQDKLGMIERIESIRNTYQPTQRTVEWYEYRHNLLTASSVSKILGSDAKKNSLIFEKCQPVMVNDNSQPINIYSPMHWGNKYEPVSLMLYEHIYKTVVEDFGCIRHRQINCLGASPDGINTDIDNNLYGRMLEIKNIVNREITGIPLEAYWVQMQTQMEVCNLDECDFFETKFNEFDSEENFYSSNNEHTGVILHFVSIDSVVCNPHYVYMPLSVNKDCVSISSWIRNAVTELMDTHRLHCELFWYLEKMSCVLVPRNRKWFEKLSPKIESTWAIIENERVSGCEHRKPKTRVRKCNVLLESIDNVCVTDGDTKNVSLNFDFSKRSINFEGFMKQL
jgi:putative phage-type endonuclease